MGAVHRWIEIGLCDIRPARGVALRRIMTAPILEVRDLHKSYGPTPALRGVTFQVERGAIFGLLGPNGAGKTTLLSILCGLLRADSGQARILGLTVSPDDGVFRWHIGVVPQDLALYEDLTARENLVFFGQLYGVQGHELKKRADEVLAAVGLTDRADRRVRTFSGGMKRRLNLGVAIMHRPSLLFLDEPTTGVDPQSRNHIFEEVRRLNAAGVTIVYTSHYMEEVQALCGRVGIIDHGRLIAYDTVANLLRSLHGVIRLRLLGEVGCLERRLAALPGVERLQVQGATVDLECLDVKATLVQIVALLNEQKAELVGLETEEPNLERVFLHLTGRALRD
ncbi:MAG: ABC transporter ATP-binding protein [Gemmataceae bacterium]|nr:ABC transporter ATP-binding protein [Gemmataceae bacterium]MDW8266911.1 ABC transporter ATP-binding protein [Gemmataceae bacterium]